MKTQGVQKKEGDRSARARKLILTVLISAVGFGLLAGPICPFSSSGDSDKARSPKPVKPGASVQVATADEQETAAPPASAPARKVEMGRQDSLEVGKLVLTDSGGAERVKVEIKPDGGVGLVFLDTKGHERSFFGVESDGMPMFVMRDEYGTDRARIFLGENGTPIFDMLGRRGDVRASIALQEGEDPVASLFDDQGIARASFFLKKSGDPVLNYLDRDGQEVVVIPREKQKAAAAPAPAPARRSTSSTSTSSPPAAPKPAYNGDMVVVIVKGKKPIYHLPSCPNLAPISKSDKRYLMLADVVAKGFMPCPMCKPPRLIK